METYNKKKIMELLVFTKILTIRKRKSRNMKNKYTKKQNVIRMIDFICLEDICGRIACLTGLYECHK